MSYFDFFGSWTSNSSWFPVCNDTQGPALVPSALMRTAVHFSDTVVCSYYIKISTEQNPWKTNSSSAWQGITFNSWNQDVHYHLHKSPPLVCILSQINPGHVPRTKILNVHFNIISPSSRYSNWSLSLVYTPTLPCDEWPAQSVFSSTEPVQV